MKIAIASGKGGTGKTTISVNLAQMYAAPVQLLDCDVEEPNAHLFLRRERINEEIVSIPTPVVSEKLCNGCGECSRFCEYHAIAVLGKEPLIFPEMCHGCGGCKMVCPTKAIAEVERRIGILETSISDNITLISGRLDVGVPLAPPLIRALKKKICANLPTVIDAPPGTSCPVIAAVRDTDLVLLVTEPTPFGLHDLRLAVDMIRVLRIPCGVIVNRMGIGDERVHSFCQKEKIPVLLNIPDDRRIAENYSRG
ncbi:MAG TPA: ATP-binding protein, partial [Smithellaceae bacterium]|nr:ATP-binding protein [Smithellaceae bacterium]